MQVLTGLGMAAALVASADTGSADKADLAAVLAQWDRHEHPDLRGVVVLRDGQSVAERYYNGATPEELQMFAPPEKA